MAKRRRRKAAPPMQAKRTKQAAAALALAPVLPLPDDLVDDVFLRLPPRTLAVCGCVSPPWNRLLSSPSFAELYHAASAAGAASAAAPRFVSVAPDRRWHNRHIVTAPTKTIPRRSLCWDCPRVFCGAAKTCHGVFLLGRPCEGEFSVCNPSTGGVLRLPPRRPPWYFHSAGLGYDAAAGEHKAVLLEREAGLPPRWWIPRLQCLVVTVGGRQQRWRWRAPRHWRAPIVCDDALVSTDIDPVFADERLHWVLSASSPAATTTSARDEPNGILSFSVSSESFRRLPLPPFAATDVEQHHTQPSSSSDSRTQRTMMGELDGRLCMVRDRGRVLFEVWKLHDHDEAGSWSLDCRIDLTRLGKELFWPWIIHVFPLRYMGGDKSKGESKQQILLVATSLETARICDLDTGEMRTVARRNNTTEDHMRFLLYQESPVHISGVEYGRHRSGGRVYLRLSNMIATESI